MLTDGQRIGNGSVLVDIGQAFEFGNLRHFLIFRNRTLHKSVEARKLRTEVEVMKESILVGTDVDEGRIEPGHQFLDPTEVNVANRIFYIPCLLLKRHQTSVLQQSNGNIIRLNINYQFTSHAVFFNSGVIIIGYQF